MEYNVAFILLQVTRGTKQDVLTNVLFKDRLEESVEVIASLSAESL